jgi:oxygen-independent coproporphyrinogen-3 oxidase
MIGAYIHIPFCNRICSYCDFSKVFYNKKIVDDYLNELELEIKDSYKEEELNTIYIGGGTPSALDIKQLEKLFKIINTLKISNLKEYTIECNFDSITKEKLDLFKKYKINRISFGLESTINKNLKLLERDLDKDKVKEIINYCHKIGINNINVDLIYALPNETIDDLKKDLDFIKSLDITHISTYSLMIEEHTILNNKKTKNIDENLDREMYELINKELNEYDHYEISNFAKEKKYRSIHNYSYWENKNYYGFGLSSSGYLNNIRYVRTRSLTKYFNHDYMKDNGIEFLNTKDKIYYEIILRLRTKEGINLKEFKDTYHNDLEKYYDYKDLLEKNLLELKDNHLSIPINLWYISNSVIVELLEGERNERAI